MKLHLKMHRLSRGYQWFFYNLNIDTVKNAVDKALNRATAEQRERAQQVIEEASAILNWFPLGMILVQ